MTPFAKTVIPVFSWQQNFITSFQYAPEAEVVLVDELVRITGDVELASAAGDKSENQKPYESRYVIES
jgi:hypothetical protein